jgi:hypothetical protein
MRCWRIIKQIHHSEDRDFLRTEFSALTPGRWNQRTQPVLYTGESIETVFAEAGIYWVLREAEILNGIAKGKAPTAWQDMANNFKEVPAKVAELEIDPNLKLCLIGKPPDANTMLTNAKMSHIHHSTYLKHDFRSLKGYPTRQFGKWLQDQKYDGFQIASARRPGGLSTVIFDPKATQGAVRVVNVTNATLFGLKQKGGRIDSRFSNYDENTFEYEIHQATHRCTPEKYP